MTARRRLAALGLALPMLAVAAPAPALAAGITVSTLTDVVNGTDGLCSFREAIEASNDDAPSGVQPGECTSGAGDDIISFVVTGTIHLASNLPSIEEDATIDGGDAITIDGDGHGMFLVQEPADVVIRRIALTDAGSGYGPAIHISGTSRIDRVTVTDSHATEWGGGVMVSTDANVTIVDSTFHDNTADYGGGVYVATNSTVTIVRSTVSDNTALFEGGGIYGVGAAQITVANSTVYRNGGADGAGIYMSNTDLTVHNSTITKNQSASRGGGVSVDSGPMSVLVNSIVTGNTDEEAGTATDDIAGALDTDSQNLVGAEAAGVLDPAGLADNGGRTRTVAILPTAVATIDQGHDATCHNDNVDGVDQRGFIRLSGACDIGSVELDRIAPVMGGNPRGSLAEGTMLSGTKPRIQLGWSGSDAGGSGIALFLIERSVDGGAWTEVATTNDDDAEFVLPAKGARYRVTPIDGDGNVGTPTTSRTLRADLTQQTYAGITYTKSWRTARADDYSGGSVRYARSKGASSRFLVTGRGVGFVTTVGPNRGKAKILINGSLVQTIDLKSSSTHERVLAWQQTWATSATRTIKVVVVGTSGRPRVDVDAFVVLK